MMIEYICDGLDETDFEWFFDGGWVCLESMVKFDALIVEKKMSVWIAFTWRTKLLMRKIASAVNHASIFTIEEFVRHLEAPI